MGATVFYNYLDLRLRNPLGQPLLFRAVVDPPLLRGAVYSDRPLPFQVRVLESSHRFFRDREGAAWRENRVVKEMRFADGRPPQTTEIAHNRGRVCYSLPDEAFEAESSSGMPEPAIPSTGSCEGI
jgi:vancomycin resistance protein VanW